MGGSPSKSSHSYAPMRVDPRPVVWVIQQAPPQLVVVEKPVSMEPQAVPVKQKKKKFTDQQEPLFVLDDELTKLFYNGFNENIPSEFFERNWVSNPDEQHIADLLVIVKMAEYFGKEREFLMQLEDHCQIETKKQIKSPDRPDFIKFKNLYQAAEDLFNKYGSDLQEKFKTDVKLQAVSGETIDENNTSAAFIKSRVADAFQKKPDFQTYLKSIVDKFFNEEAELVVNSKDEARVIEKVREMQMEPEKYPAPAENYLYDLLRAQIRINPEDLDFDSSMETIGKIIQFFKSLIEEDKFIRFKNKITELGQISCNFIFDNHIVELQIVFAQSLAALKRSHIVYDLERLVDFSAVRTYLMKKKSNRTLTGLFARIGMNAFDDELNECNKAGSLVLSHFIHYVLINPNIATYPIFPSNNSFVCKGLIGKMILNIEKNAYEGQRVKAIQSDGNEYDGEWTNFFLQGQGRQISPSKDIYECVFRDGKKQGKGKIIFSNKDVLEGEWINDKLQESGKITHSDGGLYEGALKDGKKHGKGKETTASGDVYEGKFENGFFSGQGKMIYKSGGNYDGEWKDGKKNGKGKETTASGDIYEGGFENGLYSGQGKTTYSNGGFYKGEWKDGKKYQGKGKEISESGDIYEGEYENGLYSGQGQMTYKNGGFYEGEWKEGKKHKGKGKQIFKDGSIYEGGYENNLYSGQGQMKYGNGGFYEGEWKDSKKQRGKGKEIYDDGSSYEGEYKNGFQHGHGKTIRPNGDIYEGEYKNSKRHGNGKYTWGSGTVYEGDWKENTMDGKGKLISTNGDVHEGEFMNGKAHGNGKKIYKIGDVYEGGWKDHKRDGKGKQKYQNGNVYEGDWKDDKMEGKGKMNYQNGDVYQGDWKDNKRNGVGRHSWGGADLGQVYQGNFSNDLFNGFASLMYKNGDNFEGNFKDGQKHGQGKMYYSNGVKYVQEWRNGVKH